MTDKNNLITMGMGTEQSLCTLGMGQGFLATVLREVLRLISLIDFRPGGH